MNVELTQAGEWSQCEPAHGSQLSWHLERVLEIIFPFSQQSQNAHTLTTATLALLSFFQVTPAVTVIITLLELTCQPPTFVSLCLSCSLPTRWISHHQEPAAARTECSPTTSCIHLWSMNVGRKQLFSFFCQLLNGVIQSCFPSRKCPLF